MALAVGSAPVADVRYGGASVAAVHLGAAKVWPMTGGASLPVTRGIFAQFDATSITGITDGQPLGTWADASGRGHDATADTTGPTYRVAPTSSNIAPDMPVVEFGDGTAMGIGIDPLTVAPGEYTAIAAVSHTFPDTSRARTLLGGKLLAKIGPGLRPALTLRLVTDLNPSPTAIPQEEFTILVWRYSDATDAYSYRIDGAAAGGGTSTASPAGAGNLPHKLGNYENLEYWWGEVAEVIEYAAHLTDAECSQVEDYLRTKWGIT